MLACVEGSKLSERGSEVLLHFLLHYLNSITPCLSFLNVWVVGKLVYQKRVAHGDMRSLVPSYGSVHGGPNLPLDSVQFLPRPRLRPRGVLRRKELVEAGHRLCFICWGKVAPAQVLHQLDAIDISV